MPDDNAVAGLTAADLLRTLKLADESYRPTTVRLTGEEIIGMLALADALDPEWES